MKTTLDIDEKILSEVMKISHSETKKGAILTALKEYLKMKKREELAAMIGNYPDFDLTMEDLAAMRNEQ